MATPDHHDETGARPSSSHGGRIQCVVVTPERTLMDESVESAIIPLFDGEFGLLPGHTPLIGRLGFGDLRVRGGAGGDRRVFLDGGFAQFRDNVLTILTQRALTRSQVEPAAARQELQQATALPATTDPQRDDKDRALARARALVRFTEQS